MDMIVLVYIGGAIALVALAVLFISLALMLKDARAMMNDKINPMLDDAKDMTESLKPAVAQIDPLMERINLTMDAANLEIMRVDEIMEDVSVITDKLANTTTSVNEIANMPLNAVNTATSKVRGLFKKNGASSTSAKLGEAKESATD
jgi:uncharacterized protein YoxC